MLMLMVMEKLKNGFLHIQIKLHHNLRWFNWDSSNGPTLADGPGNFKFLKFTKAPGATERLMSNDVVVPEGTEQYTRILVNSDNVWTSNPYMIGTQIGAPYQFYDNYNEQFSSKFGLRL